MSLFERQPSSIDDHSWIWRSQLEEERKNEQNNRFYDNYMGKSVKSESNKERLPTFHLKHVVKIGCPLHDLLPIFSNLGYKVNPTLCSHKSYKCLPMQSQTISNTTKLSPLLFATFSINEVGILWKRKAFSIKPLHIQYIDNVNNKECSNTTFTTDLYVMKASNTNFAKVYRPGSFGTLDSLKNGSWKEGKAFYVFKNEQITLNITDDIFITFELASPSALLPKNGHSDRIDGWKDIVGGVGFYVPNDKVQDISTCIVLRKATENPTECVKLSQIKIFSRGNTSNKSSMRSKLIIGSKTIFFNKTNGTTSMNYSSNEDKMECENDEYQTTETIGRPVFDYVDLPEFESLPQNFVFDTDLLKYESSRSDGNIVMNNIHHEMNTIKLNLQEINANLKQNNEMLSAKCNQLERVNVQFITANSILHRENQKLVRL